tara:strand:+ start:681 stop:1718 length:1038 start_codon:yes stop_codon:yes gene_type:complete
MNELAQILSESVTRLFEDLATREVLEEAETGIWPENLWKELEEMGVMQALVPEESGGVGASWNEVESVIRAAGRYCIPVPLVETMVASWLCSSCGLEVPKGILTLAAGGKLEGSGSKVKGVLDRVPWGGRATAILAEAVIDGEDSIVLLEPDSGEKLAGQNLAKEPRDTLSFTNCAILTGNPLSKDFPKGLVELYGALARSVQITGALENLLGESVQFANDRVQFGRPIGKFQAIQHQLAILASETAAARAASSAACTAADSKKAFFEIAVAKARSGEAAGIGSKIAHATHGAIGFTYEHALHFTTRRLWSWRAEFGAEAVWRDRLGEKALDRGADNLWTDLVSQ